MNLADLLQKWDSFDSLPLPIEQPEVCGHQLFVAMIFSRLKEGINLDLGDLNRLLSFTEQIASLHQTLTGPIKEYVDELLEIIDLLIQRTSRDPAFFPSIVAVDLMAVLKKRTDELLPPNTADFSVALATAVQLVADVLRDPILDAPNRAQARESLTTKSLELLQLALDQLPPGKK